ncbi:MAG TPA: nucleoside-diphosphate kinase [Thermodesulfobacteriota bacterium]|nr:nucleoside-diphosphate kinase [Thermodesulfobacteriota bacterium]
MEKTLSIVKPDGVEKNVIGEVIRRFESEGMKVIGLKMVKLSKEQAQGFYAVHKERPFFDSLTDFMSSGPCVLMVLQGENAIKTVRTTMGATNPAEADNGTIRKDFASDIEHNIVHGSDSTESADYEIVYFFNDLELA